MNLATTPAQVVGKLVIQIQKLVQDPAHPLKTPDRSPLFQVAAHVELPHLSINKPSTSAITDKTFADIRQEALKDRHTHPRKKNSLRKCRLSAATLQTA